MPDRPLSPHLGVYKFKYTLLSSILNRITGGALSAGLLVLAYWLMALASGRESYEQAVVVLSHPFLKLIYAGLTFTFVYHLLAGVRHLVWDTARGMERRQAQWSSWLIGGLSVVLTVAIIAIAVLRPGAP